MKYSNDNILFFGALKYTKLLCLKSFLLVLIASCGIQNKRDIGTNQTQIIEECLVEDEECIYEERIIANSLHHPILGIDRLHLFIDSLQNKNIAVVSNQTSMVGNVHLVDTLLALNLNV